MSEQYPGGFISKSPPIPAGPYNTSAAQGMWTMSQAAGYQKQGLWPIPGNVPPFPAQWPSSSPITFGTQVNTGYNPLASTSAYVCGIDTYGAWYLNVQRTSDAPQSYVFYINSNNTLTPLGFLPSTAAYFGGVDINGFAAGWDSIRNRYIVGNFTGQVKVIYSSGALTSSSVAGVVFTGSDTLLGGITGLWDVCYHDRTTDVYVIATRTGDWYTVNPTTLAIISSATGVNFYGGTNNTYGLSRDFATGKWLGFNRDISFYFQSTADILSSSGVLQNLSQTWDAVSAPWTISGQKIDKAVIGWTGSLYYMNSAGSSSNPHVNYYAPRTA
jgi:hypothetical protein